MTFQLTVDVRAVLIGVVVLLAATGIVTPFAISLANDDDGPEQSSAQQALAGSTFTYQGQLNDGSGPANGTYDFRFRLYEDALGNTQVQPPVLLLVEDVVVTNGLFNTSLDFGAPVFNGDARYMEVSVRPGASAGGYTSLTPLQALAPVPYALSAPWSGLTGVPAGFADGVDDTGVTYTVVPASGITLVSNALGSDPSLLQRRVTPGCAANSSIRTVNQDGSVVCEPDDVGSGWSLTGNAGTTGANFLGTTDSTGLELRVNGQRALRLEPGSTPNMVGGFSGNAVTVGVIGGTIDGGGAAGGDINRVTDNFGTVGGGFRNRAGNDSGTTGDVLYTTVGGGYGNTASGNQATVGGGASNTASGSQATVGGGTSNTASMQYATVGGGGANSASNIWATVGGGSNNTASGHQSVVGGGSTNNAAAPQGTIGGGYANTASGTAYATVGGGSTNTASGLSSTVGGGVDNIASSSWGTVGGGASNTATNAYATVGGGSLNDATGNSATVGGGGNNNATQGGSTVSGGSNNNATGAFATVPGGLNNLAQGIYSFAGGQRAKVYGTGSFVWADSQNLDYNAFDNNTFEVRAAGGLWFGGNVYVNGVLVHASDQRLKRDIAASAYGLAEVLALSPKTYRWNEGKGDEAFHLGFIAQDVQWIIPELVSETREGMLGMEYLGLIPVLTRAIQEQQLQIEALKASGQWSEASGQLPATAPVPAAQQIPVIAQSLGPSSISLFAASGALALFALAVVAHATVSMRRRIAG
jgi:hypothetical protein